MRLCNEVSRRLIIRALLPEAGEVFAMPDAWSDSVLSWIQASGKTSLLMKPRSSDGVVRFNMILVLCMLAVVVT